MKPLRRRQKFGKYIIEGRLGEGGFATVYRARDTIEGISVALKIPHDEHVNRETLDLFKREARLAARLDDPHVLGLKYADFIDGRFVVVTALGEETLESRLRRRLATSKTLVYAEQMIAAVACAHHQRIIHCDIKPDNFIIFADDHIRLADFGIAIVAQRTVQGSGAGTVGYMAPEQALGRPSMRSDVFSLGLVLYRMFTGVLPQWPFQHPLPGQRRLAERVHPDIVRLVHRAMEVDSRKRYASAEQMLVAFERVPAAKRGVPGRARSRRNGRVKSAGMSARRGSWRTVRIREFQSRFKSALRTNHCCSRCEGPLAESMRACPWCGKSQSRFAGEPVDPEQCPRCLRGMKRDWKYCPWCRGGAFELTTNRKLTDRRYVRGRRCQNGKCPRQRLFRFMRYCPWCNTKVRKPWKLVESSGTASDQSACRKCGWGVLPDFWSYCPWCATPVKEAGK